jgi:hypothetical protein
MNAGGPKLVLGKTLFACAVVLFLSAAVNVHASEGSTPVFIGGEKGYPVYRIPAALVAVNGDPLDGEPSILLYSSQGSTEKRMDGTLYASVNEGQSWYIQYPIHAGHFAYAHLVRTPDAAIGCLYETGANGPYERIVFARIDRAVIISPD